MTTLTNMSLNVQPDQHNDGNEAQDSSNSNAAKFNADEQEKFVNDRERSEMDINTDTQDSAATGTNSQKPPV